MKNGWEEMHKTFFHFSLAPRRSRDEKWVHFAPFLDDEQQQTKKLLCGNMPVPAYEMTYRMMAN